MKWMARAACQDQDPELFFPHRGEMDKLRAAKAVCRACPVREECLDYALPYRDLIGVWGGLSELERNQRHRVA